MKKEVLKVRIRASTREEIKEVFDRLWKENQNICDVVITPEDLKFTVYRTKKKKELEFNPSRREE